MKVRILNHDAYGVGELHEYLIDFPVGSVHEVVEFFQETGEVDLGARVAFDPSEYEVVGE